ncbi:rhomboid protease ROM6, partial [Toxoplasma gondii ARI]
SEGVHNDFPPRVQSYVGVDGQGTQSPHHAPRQVETREAAEAPGSFPRRDFPL